MKLNELELHKYFLPHAVLTAKKYVNENKYNLSNLYSLNENRDCKNNFIKVENETESVYIFGNCTIKTVVIE
jgi:hypothetical protein